MPRSSGGSPQSATSLSPPLPCGLNLGRQLWWLAQRFSAEFERARSELASTGQPGMVARAELTRCAVQVASLVFDACTGFDAIRRDSPPAAAR